MELSICLPGYMEAETSQTQFLVGVAWDGFPIYNKFDADGAEIDNSMLDECHGYNATDGSGYRYIVNDEFPYIIGCFVGTPLTSVSGACVGSSRGRLSAEKIARFDAEVQRVLSRRRLLQGGGGSNSGGGSNNGGSGSSTQDQYCGTACSGTDCGEDASVAMCDADTPSPTMATDASEPTVNPTNTLEPTLNPTLTPEPTSEPSSNPAAADVTPSPTESPIADP